MNYGTFTSMHCTYGGGKETQDLKKKTPPEKGKKKMKKLIAAVFDWFGVWH